MNFVTIITALGISSIPALVVSGIVSRQINKLGQHIDKKEAARNRRDYLMVKGNLASIGLSKAMAKELSTLGKTNGETAKAMEYATEVEHKIEDFFVEQGTENLQ